MSDTRSSSGGVGFISLLTLVFVVAKITGYIDWTWGWVFSPLLIGWSFVIVIFLLVVLVDPLAFRRRR